MSASLKIGLMGYGFAGATFHAPVIKHCGRACSSEEGVRLPSEHIR